VDHRLWPDSLSVLDDVSGEIIDRVEAGELRLWHAISPVF